MIKKGGTMRYELVFSLGLLLGITGCVLDGKEKPPQKQNASYAGVVNLTDISTVASDNGMAYQADISARFQADPLLAPRGMRRFPVAFSREKKGFQCQLVTNSAKQARDTSSWVPVSVGKLVLGTMTSSKQIEIIEGDNHSYFKELMPRFAPGLYFIAAEGKGKLKPFQVEFVMPEELRGPRVNEHHLEEGPAIIQKSSPLVVEWDAPTAPNDMNLVELYIVTRQGQEERTLACGVVESQLEAVGGKVRVEIPAPQMSGLFATPEGVVELLRVNELAGTVTNGPSLRLDGVRAWVWPGLVAE
ncbi:MAG: hypothetical protein EB078_01610 [Proteobacteria bacterium]|nr:hypothetical protein [Pseudomonadota bacterium]NDD03577.1 hypothetical protein [Pseudomonadota bacterium]